MKTLNGDKIDAAYRKCERAENEAARLKAKKEANALYAKMAIKTGRWYALFRERNDDGARCAETMWSIVQFTYRTSTGKGSDRKFPKGEAIICINSLAKRHPDNTHKSAKYRTIWLAGRAQAIAIADALNADKWVP